MAPTAPDEIGRRLQSAVRLLQEGKLAEAEAVCAALTAAPGAPVDALNLHAAICGESGRLDEAVRLLERAIATAPDNPRTQFNLGVLHQRRGDGARARAAYEAAARIDPGFAPAWVNLGHLQLQSDAPAAAETAFRAALRADPQQLNAREGLGVALHLQGRNEEAAAVLQQALDLAPDNPALHIQLGVVRHSLGDAAAAADRYRHALAAQPDDAECQALLSTALYDLRDYAGALAANDAALRREPGSARALMMRALILAQRGDAAGARAVLAVDRFIRVSQPTARDDTGDGFHAAIAREILAHPTLTADRPNKTTMKGAQTGELFATPPTPALGTLRDLIVAQIHGYTDKLGGGDHPFQRSIPARWHLRSWATVLNRGGHQDPHYHPSGWLSGVYYVQVPEVIARGQDKAGYIEFGRPDPRYAIDFTPEVELFEPVPGRMVLFPSYTWHRTLPFESDEQRISVAFDVVPLR